MKDTIQKIFENDLGDIVGIRVEEERHESGFEFPQSRIWDNDGPTDDHLDGTSVIEIMSIESWMNGDDVDSAIEKAIKIAKNYFGECHLVYGIFGEYGEDFGEVVITDCIAA